MMNKRVMSLSYRKKKDTINRFTRFNRLVLHLSPAEGNTCYNNKPMKYNTEICLTYLGNYYNKGLQQLQTIICPCLLG